MRIRTNDKYISMVLKNLYQELSQDIILSATLNRVYHDKISNEIISTKVNNQLNSMEISINRINPKFVQKSKNYEKIKEQMIQTLEHFENVLRQLGNQYDEEIEEFILKKVELESKLLMAIISKNFLYHEPDKTKKNGIVKGINTVAQKIKGKINKKEQLDVGLIQKVKDGQDVEAEISNDMEQSEEYKENQKYIKKLEREIKNLNKKIDQKSQEKISQVLDAMEVGDKALSTEIRKPRTFKNIKKFFVNKFNTYHVIVKTVIEPLNQRIDEFKVNELQKVEIEIKQREFLEVEERIKATQQKVLDDFDNKLIRKKLEI